ncbi:LENG8 protein, partial [Polypterus senegalus]
MSSGPEVMSSVGWNHVGFPLDDLQRIKREIPVSTPVMVISGNRTTSPGDSLHISCQSSRGTDPIHYQLYFRNQQNNDIQLTEDSGPISYKLNITGEVQTGSYWCRANNSEEDEPALSNEINIMVIVPVSGASLMSNLSGTGVSKGSSIFLTCTLSAGTEPRFIWFHNDHELPSIDPAKTYALSEKGSYLTIYSVSERHEGDYYCVAVNGVGDSKTYTSSSSIVQLKIAHSSPVALIITAILITFLLVICIAFLAIRYRSYCSQWRKYVEKPKVNRQNSRLPAVPTAPPMDEWREQNNLVPAASSDDRFPIDNRPRDERLVYSMVDIKKTTANADSVEYYVTYAMVNLKGSIKKNVHASEEEEGGTDDEVERQEERKMLEHVRENVYCNSENLSQQYSGGSSGSETPVHENPEWEKARQALASISKNTNTSAKNVAVGQGQSQTQYASGYSQQGQYAVSGTYGSQATPTTPTGQPPLPPMDESFQSQSQPTTPTTPQPATPNQHPGSVGQNDLSQHHSQNALGQLSYHSSQPGSVQYQSYQNSAAGSQQGYQNTGTGSHEYSNSNQGSGPGNSGQHHNYQNSNSASQNSNQHLAYNQNSNSEAPGAGGVKFNIQKRPYVLTNQSFASSEQNNAMASSPSQNNVTTAKPEDWPQAMKEYVQRCFTACESEEDKDRTEKVLKEVLQGRLQDGSAYTIDWSREPLPELKKNRWETVSHRVSESISQTSGRLGSTASGGLSGRVAMTGRTRGGGSSTNSSHSSFSPHKLGHYRNVFTKDQSTSSSSSRSRSRSSSPHRRQHHRRSDSGSPSDSSLSSDARPLVRRNQKGDRGRGGRGRGGRGNRGRRNADDSGTAQKRGRRKGGCAGLDFEDPEREFKKQNRAARFQTGPSGKKLRTEPLVLQINSFDNHSSMTCGDGLDWEDFKIVGTSQEITKHYLRLTCAPDPSTVRPVAVQGIRTEFTVEVYETHARIALEKGDHEEFNQCQTQLKALYGESLSGNVGEFTAYRILYYIFTKNSGDITTELAYLTREMKTDPCVSHALALRTAWALGNYHKFFCLYRTAPRMGAYLIDKFVERERKLALKAIIKAFRPAVPIEYIQSELAFQTQEDCLAFLNGLSISYLGNDPSKIDCKLSVSVLANF